MMDNLQEKMDLLNIDDSLNKKLQDIQKHFPCLTLQFDWSKLNGSVLLIGEGDFDFALKILEAQLVLPKGLYATEFRNEDQLKNDLHQTYEKNMESLKKLLPKEHIILEVDAKNFTQKLPPINYQTIIWNAPWNEDSNGNTLSNFFLHAAEFQKEGDKIYLRLYEEYLSNNRYGALTYENYTVVRLPVSTLYPYTHQTNYNYLNMQGNFCVFEFTKVSTPKSLEFCDKVAKLSSTYDSASKIAKEILQDQILSQSELFKHQFLLAFLEHWKIKNGNVQFFDDDINPLKSVELNQFWEIIGANSGQIKNRIIELLIIFLKHKCYSEEDLVCLLKCATNPGEESKKIVEEMKESRKDFF